MTNNPHRAMTEQYQQAPTETSRKTRASIATLGLAISMGATGLLLPRQGDHAIAAEPIPAPSISSPATTAASNTYTVQQSDTLATIARLHDIAPEALAAANHLSIGASLQAGQQLIIPARSLPQTVASTIEPAAPAADPTEVSASTASTDRTATEAADVRTHDSAPVTTEATVTDEAVKVVLNQASVPALPDAIAEDSKTPAASEATQTDDTASTPSALSGSTQPVTVSPLSAAPSESPSSDDRDRSANAMERLQAQQERLNQALGTLAANTGTLLGSTTEAIELLALQPTPSPSTSQDAASEPSTSPTATDDKDPSTATVSLKPSQPEEASPAASTASDTGLVASIPTALDNRVTAVAVPVQPINRPAVPINATTALSAAEAGGGAANALNSLAGATDSPAASSRFQPTAASNDLASPRYSPYIDGLRAEIQALQVRYQNQAQGTPARSGAISLLAPAAATAVAASQVPAAAAIATKTNSNPLTDRAATSPQPLASDDPRRSQLVATAPEPLNERNPRIQTLLNSSVSPQLPPLSSPSAYLPGAQPQQQAGRGYIWPTQGTLTSGYGWRWGRMHKGIDIAAPVGTPVVAAAGGVVVSSGWDSGGYGNKVDIRHPDGSVTRYGHNSRLLVREGQEVRQGQLISEMGSTGRSTGPHLHFEVHPSGRGAINPMAFLPNGGLRAAR